MAAVGISYFGNNLIQYDNTVYTTEVNQQNSVAVIVIYKLIDRSQEACQIIGGICILWKVPLSTITFANMTVGNGIKATLP